jgi:hypothetical protein
MQIFTFAKAQELSFDEDDGPCENLKMSVSLKEILSSCSASPTN